VSADEIATTGDAAAGETYAEGARLALVCVDAPDRQGPVKSALQELGYTVQGASSGPDAIERIRKSAYEVIVLDEEFQGSTEHDHAVLKALHAMPMATRRYIFVALLGRRFGTLDNMMAFAKSVNLVVHVSDLSQLQPILARGIAENDRFYRVFREVLREAGKR
jgi:CheY-like chemotaxis protein